MSWHQPQPQHALAFSDVVNPLIAYAGQSMLVKQ